MKGATGIPRELVSVVTGLRDGGVSEGTRPTMIREARGVGDFNYVEGLEGGIQGELNTHALLLESAMAAKLW